MHPKAEEFLSLFQEMVGTLEENLDLVRSVQRHLVQLEVGEVGVLEAAVNAAVTLRDAIPKLRSGDTKQVS